MRLSSDDVFRLRFAAHGLRGARPDGPVATVDRAGAIQGQDLRAVTDAVALRADVEAADVAATYGLDGIVRSWPMRGTLFATTPRRLGQFLSFTAPRMTSEMTRRRRSLGIDDRVIDRASEVAADVLASGPVERGAVHGAWNAAGIDTSGGWAYHLTVTLALRAEVAWGPMGDGDQQLIAVSPDDLSLPEAAADPEATLDALVTAYVAGHGPVGVDEAAWWMKLPKTPVRAAAARLAGTLVDVDVDGRPMVVVADALEELDRLPPHDPDEVHLLPRFDEWTLGYHDRSLVASPAMVEAIDPKRNGQFRRIVVVGGRVVATWERDRARQPVLGPVVETISAAQRRAVDAALATTTLA